MNKTTNKEKLLHFVKTFRKYKYIKCLSDLSANDLELFDKMYKNECKENKRKVVNENKFYYKYIN